MKVEIASGDEISMITRIDLPNQEKNQYTGLFIDRKQGIYIQKGDKKWINKNIWPLGRG